MKIRFHQRSIYLTNFSKHNIGEVENLCQSKNRQQIFTKEWPAQIMKSGACLYRQKYVLKFRFHQRTIHFIEYKYIYIYIYKGTMYFWCQLIEAQILLSSETNNSFHWTVPYLYIYPYTYRYQSIWISESISGNLCACAAHANINLYSWIDLKVTEMSKTYIIDKQSLDEMTPQMLIVKIVSENTEDFWGADVNIAILQRID